MKKSIIILSFLLFLPIVFAQSTLTETYNTIGSYTVNNSGQFYSGQKTCVRTAYVVVCRGTSLPDDLYKYFTCDFVCASTDNDCSNEIEKAINNTGDIYISSGVYPIRTYIVPHNNSKVLGSGMTTILNLTGTDEIFRSSGGLYNFELGNLKMIQSGISNSVGFEIAESPSSNIYIHDIDFGNLNYDCLRITTYSSTLFRHSNINLERLNAHGCGMIFGKLDGLKLLDSYFNGTSSNRNVLLDVGFTENNANITNVLIQGNTFFNTNISNPIIGSSLDALGINVLNNYFYNNGSSINVGRSSFDVKADWNINGNSFNTYPNLLAYPIIQFTVRSQRSTININDNNFNSQQNSDYIGISSYSPTLISNNYFDTIGDACVIGKGNLKITNNYFSNCASYQTANGVISLYSDPDYDARNVISDNYFDPASTTGYFRLIRLSGATNTSIYANSYNNIINNTNNYYFDAGIGGVEYNSTYIDDYIYSFIPNSLCGINALGYGKTLHNSTTSCTCTGGAWKCWVMS